MTGTDKIGVIVDLSPEKRKGRILSQDGTTMSFLFRHFCGDVPAGDRPVPQLRMPVVFQQVPHPDPMLADNGVAVCQSVQSVELPSHGGRVVTVPTPATRWGTIRLDDGR